MSKAPLQRGTYEKYANPLQGCLFLALHPNESVRTTGEWKGTSRSNFTLNKRHRPRGTRGKTNSTIKARSRGLLRACFNFEFPVVVKGTKNFAGFASQIFSTQFLDKRNVRYNTPMAGDYTRTCFKLFNMCLKFRGGGIDIQCNCVIIWLRVRPACGQGKPSGGCAVCAIGR